MTVMMVTVVMVMNFCLLAPPPLVLYSDIFFCLLLLLCSFALLPARFVTSGAEQSSLRLIVSWTLSERQKQEQE